MAWLEHIGLTFPPRAIGGAMLGLAAALLALCVVLLLRQRRRRAGAVTGLAENAAHSRKTTNVSPLDTPNNEYMSKHPYSGYEVVEECEEASARGARSWYNIGGEEVVWYLPHQTYRLTSDFIEGLHLWFQREAAPYQIEYPPIHVSGACFVVPRCAKLGSTLAVTASTAG